ncbi:MAG: chromosomal replication initiator DnaA [Desulfobacterales bacterium SG8_35_2]|jgi:chromosomal replication initiator protein|nr:MAG: chromosomal replication initiator DnaA [Desulfobacterales bacterium SG8_35_2]
MLWNEVKEVLKHKLPEAVQHLWIEPLTCIRSDDNLIELVCPDKFFCSWVKENYLKIIQESLVQLGKTSAKIHFSVSSANANEQTLPLLEGNTREQLRLPAIPESYSNIRHLHPRYTFEEFMVGESNLLAHTACKAIANGETSFGSSLYINAGTGLGKSHLTHAVAHTIANNFPGTRLYYLTAQQFSSEMVAGIKSNTMDEFKSKYHNHCDVLLIEDVQSLTGKVKTQEELNELLDVLMKSGKRIILTGSNAPRALANIDDGFRSRMSAGLISTINPPDLQTSRLIIKRKAENCKLELEEDLVEYLAQCIKGDIRKLESAIVGLKAKSTLLKKNPDLAMAKEVVADIIGNSQELSAEIIRDFIARQFRVTISDLQSKSRKKAIAFPRQVSMYLARKYTEQGLMEIGRAFNRDHSTVLHSVRVITEAMSRNGSIRGQVELLAKKLQK